MFFFAKVQLTQTLRFVFAFSPILKIYLCLYFYFLIFFFLADKLHKHRMIIFDQGQYGYLYFCNPQLFKIFYKFVHTVAQFLSF